MRSATVLVSILTLAAAAPIEAPASTSASAPAVASTDIPVNIPAAGAQYPESYEAEGDDEYPTTTTESVVPSDAAAADYDATSDASNAASTDGSTPEGVQNKSLLGTIFKTGSRLFDKVFRIGSDVSGGEGSKQQTNDSTDSEDSTNTEDATATTTDTAPAETSKESIVDKIFDFF